MRATENIVIDICPSCKIRQCTGKRVYRGNINDTFPHVRQGTSIGTAAYQCQNCGTLIGAYSHASTRNHEDNFQIAALYPKFNEFTPPLALPETTKNYLTQAHTTLSAPDASAVMSGSAVDSILKELGYEKGSVYSRIDKALEDHKLTEGMAEWAHHVRLGSNRPRHADKENPHVSKEEAEQSLEFAKALGEFLFVLPARIAKGIEDSEKASEEEN